MRHQNNELKGRTRLLVTIGAIVISFLLLSVPQLLTSDEIERSSETAVRRRPTPKVLPQNSNVTTPESNTVTAVAMPPGTASVETAAPEFSTATPDKSREIIIGTAIVQRVSAAEPPEVVEKAVIRVGDTIRSEADTQVELRLVDGSSIELSPNSTLQVVDFSADGGYGKLHHTSGIVKLAIRSLLSWQLETRTLTVSPRLENTGLTV